MKPVIYITPEGRIDFRDNGVDIPFEDEALAFRLLIEERGVPFKRDSCLSIPLRSIQGRDKEPV